MKVVEYWHGTIKNYRYDGDVSNNNEEMKELVKIMGKIDVLCRMIVSIFAVYVALVMYSVAMT